MNPRLRLARIFLPPGLKKRKLTELFRLTARAFGADAPPAAAGSSLRELRRSYAGFTRDAAEGVLSDPARSAEVERRLFDEAFRFGTGIRRELRVVSPGEVMAAARVLYRGLGIDFQGSTAGEIVIRRCSFEASYTGEVCRLISRLDAGLLAGLAGGGRLEFTERLTEGAARCRARFTFSGER